MGTRSKERISYGVGPQTEQKQDGYRALTDLRCQVLKHIFRKHDWIDKIDHIFDLTAGPGISPEGKDGSPLIALRSARENDITTRAWLVEANPETYAALCTSIAQAGFDPHADGLQVKTVCGYWNHLLPALLREAQHGVVRPDFMQGLVYYDPTGWLPTEFDVLTCVHALTPRVDIALNLSCTTLKRCALAAHCPDSRRLAEFLAETGKPYWRIRTIPGAQQWTILFGTAWKDFPVYQAKDFQRLESPEGQATFAKLHLTRQELSAWGQPPLFDLGGH